MLSAGCLWGAGVGLAGAVAVGYLGSERLSNWLEADVG
jgi:hypothetical protein